MMSVYPADSPIHGTGVFSSAHFAPGRIVLRIDDSRVVTDAEPLDPERDEFEHHCDTLAGGMVVLMRHPERSINHRCDPNTYIRTIAGDRYVVALRDIRPGDEITYDYCINGDGDTAWECSCDSPTCRKHHLSGFFHLPEEVQARYLGLLDDWFVAEHRPEVDALKCRIEAEGQAGVSRGQSSPVEANGPIEDGGLDLSGIVLVVNPILDIEEIARLFRSAWGNDAPDSPPAVEHCLTHVGAYDAGRLVGFIKLAWDGGDHAFVLDTTVHADHRRRGLGRRLVRQAAAIAQRNGVEWLHVDLEPALAGFYARCGFRPTPAGLIRLKDS